MISAEDGMLRDGPVAVLNWQAWEGFLLTHVLGADGIRIDTDPFHEFPAEQFDRICDAFKTVCFQINLSVRRRLPIGIRELTNRFIERNLFVVNGLVQDVRKSNLHVHLNAIGLPSLKASQAGPSDEMLFVKTNLNYGGDLERWLPPESIAAGGLEELVSPDIGAYEYKIVPREFVQEKLWTNPAIVIERYVTNSENSFFRVYFAGERIIIVKAFAPAIIKKLSNDPRDTNYVTDVQHLKEGTDDLSISTALKRDVLTWVENTPVEFGCVDMVHDGSDNHYIVDLNLTPYAGQRVNDSFLTNFLKVGLVNATQRKLSDFAKSPLAGY